MLYGILYFFLLMPFSLISSPFPFEFFAQKSAFSKENMELEGLVLVTTPFGTIQSDLAEVSKQLKESTFVFSENVVIQLNEGQNILCDKASFSTSSMRGVCLGGLEPVKIKAPYKKSKSILITCQSMSFFVPSVSAHEIQGEGDVQIEMTGGITAIGDRISTKSKEDFAAYCLTSEEPRVCVFNTPFGLQIKSSKIEFLENEGMVRFQNPQGDFINQQGKMEFTADYLTWMPLKREMVLEGKSKIGMLPLSWKVDGTVNISFAAEEKGPFNLEAVGPSQKVQDSESELFAMGAEHSQKVKAAPIASDNGSKDCGPTAISRFNFKQGLEVKAHGNMVFSNIKRGMTLSCNGKAIYSSSAHQLTIERDASENQVQIVDRFGQIFANRALFLIDPKSKRFEVESINLTGNVSLINKLYSLKDQEASQFILAEEALIDLKTETARLLSGSGKRVLIMDKLNRMQVSAPSITIKRTEGVTPFSIKGGGDVRFSFKEEELTEIKKRFLEKTRK